MRRRAVVLTLLAAGCSDWRARVTAGQASLEPAQTLVEGGPTPKSFDGTEAVLTARARYRTKAWVVAVDDDFDDPFRAVMPLDVALAWGPLGDPKLLQKMSFHLKRRYVSARWDGSMPLPQREVMRHLSNHHLIPGTPELHAYLEELTPGDLVSLEGYLVDVDVGGKKMRTSLSREDIGNGACEILWVESAERY